MLSARATHWLRRRPVTALVADAPSADSDVLSAAAARRRAGWKRGVVAVSAALVDRRARRRDGSAARGLDAELELDPELAALTRGVSWHEAARQLRRSLQNGGGSARWLRIEPTSRPRNVRAEMSLPTRTEEKPVTSLASRSRSRRSPRSGETERAALPLARRARATCPRALVSHPCKRPDRRRRGRRGRAAVLAQPISPAMALSLPCSDREPSAVVIRSRPTPRRATMGPVGRFAGALAPGRRRPGDGASGLGSGS